MPRKHSHYFKPVPEGVTEIDVYRVLEMFGVTDQALGHAIKKLLVAGGRGAKDIARDVQEAIDTLQRRMEMWNEVSSCGKELPQVDDWITWPGLIQSGPTLPDGAVVVAQLRGGRETLPNSPGDLYWGRSGNASDVVRYKVVSP